MALTGGKDLYSAYQSDSKPKKAKKVGFNKAASEMATTEDITPMVQQAVDSAQGMVNRMPFETAYYNLCDRIHASGDSEMLKALEKIVEDYGH